MLTKYVLALLCLYSNCIICFEFFSYLLVINEPKNPINDQVISLSLSLFLQLMSIYLPPSASFNSLYEYNKLTDNTKTKFR